MKPDFKIDIEAEMLKVIDQHHLEVDRLTREQFAKVLTQAIKAGDFTRFVTVDGRQQVVYHPYSEVERLKRKLEEADARLRALADLVWETRWASEDDAYQIVVGIAAEIRSGNMDGIDVSRPRVE